MPVGCQAPSGGLGWTGPARGDRDFGVNAVVPSVQRSSPGSQDEDKDTRTCQRRGGSKGKPLPRDTRAAWAAAPAATNSREGEAPAEHRGPPKLQAQANP